MAVAFGLAVSVALLRKFLLVRKTKDSSDNKTISSFLRVVLVRHGESFNNTIHSESAYWEKRLPDPHLSNIGTKQAQCLAEWLKTARAQLINRVDEFWVSPMLRAIQTAIPVGRALGVNPRVHYNWYEEGGLFDRPSTGHATVVPGMTPAQMRQRFPQLIVPTHARGDDAGWYWVAAGEDAMESRSTARRRAAGLVEELRAKALALRSRPGMHTLMIVCHYYTIELVLAALLGTHPLGSDSDSFWLTYNTSITALDLKNCSAGGLSVHTLMFNRVEHLDSDILFAAELGSR